MPKKRPEHKLPAFLFYNEDEARKYTCNSRNVRVQSEISERALELLNLPDEPCLLLDIGCGSGLSGEVLTENGHHWVGVDISQSMLNVALEKQVEGDLILSDIGNGLPFRPGSFQGAVSVSAIQWLCNAEQKDQNPIKRLRRFFESLYACLSRGSVAALQFYPESSAQVDLITRQAMKSGFTGGVVVDYPESTKAKKIYLVIFTGGQKSLPAPMTNLNSDQQRVCQVMDRESVGRKNVGKKPAKKSREWILHKKEKARKSGRTVALDSKYTGRKRRVAF